MAKDSKVIAALGRSAGRSVVWAENVLPTDFCPWCLRRFDRASGDGKPKPGDLHICIGCGQTSVFTDDMRSRRLEAAEETKLLAEDRDLAATIAEMRRAWKALQPKRDKPEGNA